MAVGIDWATDAWLAVGVDDGLTVETDPDFERVVAAFDDETVLVDIPIGLVSADWLAGREDHRRDCDTCAREVLGSRSSSVFPPPSREALEAVRAGADHATVSDANREATGKGLSIQAYNIADSIAEVDSVLRSCPDARGRVREAHPEVCFRAFAGAPLSHSKTTAAGFGERLGALDDVVEAPERTVRAVAERLADPGTGAEADADVDDVCDAVALAYAAAAPEGNLRTLPADPPRDDTGLPMEMVYRAEAALLDG